MARNDRVVRLEQEKSVQLRHSLPASPCNAGVGILSWVTMVPKHCSAKGLGYPDPLPNHEAWHVPKHEQVNNAQHSNVGGVVNIEEPLKRRTPRAVVGHKQGDGGRVSQGVIQHEGQVAPTSLVQGFNKIPKKG